MNFIEIKEYPTLYKEGQNGRKYLSKIKIERYDEYSKIIVEYGYENGKMQRSERKIEKTMNKGKRNERNPYEVSQTIVEYEINKKRGVGYKEEGENNEELFFPMLCQDYKKNSGRIEYPCYVQPKYDGIRAIYRGDKLYTRNGKEIIACDHIKRELRGIVPEGYIIDGEIYYKNSLESSEENFRKTVSLAKKRRITKEYEEESSRYIKYIIFDIIDKDEKTETYEERLSNLREVFDDVELKSLELIETRECKSERELKEDYYIEYRENEYEGVIIRNKVGLYKENYRSYDIQKYKEFEEDEYKIVSYKEGIGKDKGAITFICYNKEGDNTFAVRIKGPIERRREMYKNGEKYIGKELIVQYQGLSVNGKRPRFPIGKEIRDYE